MKPCVDRARNRISPCDDGGHLRVAERHSFLTHIYEYNVITDIKMSVKTRQHFRRPLVAKRHSFKVVHNTYLSK